MIWARTYLSVLPYLASALTNVDHSFRRRQAVANIPADVPSYYVSMPIDHFNKSDTRTYNNRYFINDTYYQSGGPVFFYDFGETAATQGTAGPMLAETNGPSVVMRLARKYNGMAIGWEHRYYGASQPFLETIVGTSSIIQGSHETWQYLTLEQSLEDVAYFARHFNPEGYTEEQAKLLAPRQTPWIWIGGSLPGSRGAWARLRNPDIIYAVWSSSAPVETNYDGAAYFDMIEASMPANCSADVKAIVKFVDESMDRKHGEDAYQQLQQLVYAVNAKNYGYNVSSLDLSLATSWDQASIAYELVRPWFMNFQYYGPAAVMNPFCDYIESYNSKALAPSSENAAATIDSILNNPGNGEITDEGIVSSLGMNWGIQAYMYALVKLQVDINNLQQTQSSSSQPFEQPLGNSDQTWGYQKLTELGWMQASSPENITIVSKFYNFTYAQQSMIRSWFDANDQIPSEPNVKLALDKYGGWNMQPSNVMFTNGEYDPWRSFSVMSTTAYKGAPVRKVVQTIPMCGTPPSGTDVFGLLYPGAVHVEDFIPDENATSDSPGNQGFELFSAALDQWLPCFSFYAAIRPGEGVY